MCLWMSSAKPLKWTVCESECLAWSAPVSWNPTPCGKGTSAKWCPSQLRWFIMRKTLGFVVDISKWLFWLVLNHHFTGHHLVGHHLRYSQIVGNWRWSFPLSHPLRPGAIKYWSHSTFVSGDHRSVSSKVLDLLDQRQGLDGTHPDGLLQGNPSSCY